MVFESKPTSIIWAKNAETGDFLSIGGVTRETLTPETAVTQINKVVGICGLSVTSSGMVRIGTEEAVNNG